MFHILVKYINILTMTINILDSAVEIDGIRYERVDPDSEKWGLKEIAIYLGHTHSDGTPNVNNLYRNVETELIKFPNFDRRKAFGSKKPWTKKEVIDWLSIPIKKRREMYREQQAKA